MSRQDIQEILDILDKIIKSIYPDCIITPVGGYRRGKEFSGDLDVVVSHPQETVTNNLLKEIVEKLMNAGLQFKKFEFVPYSCYTVRLRGFACDTVKVGLLSFSNKRFAA